jgi:ribosome-associated protein
LFPDRRSPPITTAARLTPPATKSVATTQAQAREALLRACQCARIAEDFKGQDVLVLDLREVTPIVDYFVLVTGSSPRQMHALAEEVSRIMKHQGSRALSKEGEQGGTWILHDYGDVVLHVFNADSRQLYDLEHLWADAPRVDWKSVDGKAATP